MREIVNRGFTPRRIAAWEKRACEVVDACLAGLRAAATRFDLVERLAIPLPVTIIAEMLGIEPERRARLQALVRRDHLERHRTRPRDALQRARSATR